ncbi:MAG: hypothetical protein ABR575_11010 [Actinomycetota bacterium]
MVKSYSTRPSILPLRFWHRTAWARRIVVLLFAFVIVGALFGLVGLRHSDVSSESAGYGLRVRYPELSRAGLASPFDIYVRHEGGFDSPITLKISHEYFTLFDLNGVYPAPSAEAVDGGMLVWEFDPPEGDVFRVHVDWRVQPSVHRGTPGTVELEIDGAPITAVSFDTRLAP